MAYEIGTASGYTDLLERVIYFLSDPDRIIGDHPNMSELVAIDDDVASGEASQAWTVEEWNDNRLSDGSGEMEVFLNGPGAAGTDEIYVWIDTVSSIGNDWYNWRLAGMTGYTSTADIDAQPGVTQGRLPRMLLYTNPIPYWIFGNGRRFIVVAKIGTVYESCYLGFSLPFGLPTQFPYPLVIGGAACPDSTAVDNRYSSVDASHRCFANPFGPTTSIGVIPQGTFDTESSLYRSTLKLLIGNTWVTMANLTGTGVDDYTNDNNVWPYCCSEYNYDSDAIPYNIFSTGLRENIDGSYPLFQTLMMLNTPVDHIAGGLQGVFAVPGFGGISAEDTFTISGDTYIAFPTLYNPGRNHWMAIKKE